MTSTANEMYLQHEGLSLSPSCPYHQFGGLLLMETLSVLVFNHLLSSLSTCM